MRNRQVAKQFTASRSGLPPYLERPAKRGDWDRPTAWLLGTKLLGSLKSLLLSEVHRSFDLRDWMTPGEIPIEPGDECWIDYFADTGDSPLLVYRLAQLLQQKQLVTADGQTLPRGRLLVMGGDTAYPVADRVALVERVCAPFEWARQVVDTPGDPVPMLAVPGNHDYYDMLDGFARQFRPECSEPPSPDEGEERQLTLDLPGYQRVQPATYFALSLPGGWQLWGIDAELGIDNRQVAYFKEKLAATPPEKLIVATSRPLIVRGAVADAKDSIAVALRRIGLRETFRDPQTPPKSGYAPRVQLDLSGDVHVYQRYYGDDTDRSTAPRHESYASVVCGLGGAFHHPNNVRHGDLPERKAYPSRDESARAIGRVLISPLGVFRAGAAGVIGLAVAFCFFMIASMTTDQTPLFVLGALRNGWYTPIYIDDIVRIVGTGIVIGLWVLLIWLAAFLTRIVRARMWNAPEKWPQRWLYDVFNSRALKWLMELLGARPRVVHVSLLTGWAWLAVLAFPLLAWDITPLQWKELGYHTTQVTLLAVIFIAGTMVLGAIGGWNKPTSGAFVAVGLLHGIVQVLAPYQWTLHFLEHPVCAGIELTALVAIAYGAGRLALTLKELPRRIALVIIGITLVAATVGLPLVQPLHRTVEKWPGSLIAALLGALFTCLLLGWYFLVILQLQGHGNEAGSVARVDDYAVFLRMHLTKDGAEVWAIAPTDADPKCGDPRSTATVVDHFVVGKRSA